MKVWKTLDLESLRMNEIRSEGKAGSIGRYAAPALLTANILKCL